MCAFDATAIETVGAATLGVCSGDGTGAVTTSGENGSKVRCCGECRNVLIAGDDCLSTATGECLGMGGVCRKALPGDCLSATPGETRISTLGERRIGGSGDGSADGVRRACGGDGTGGSADGGGGGVPPADGAMWKRGGGGGGAPPADGAM